MTDLKDELTRIQPVTQQTMTTEAATVLRFAGGLHLVSGRILIEAELDSPVVAHRLRTFLQLFYNVELTVIVVSGGSPKRGKRYVVRVVHKTDGFARMTGLVDPLRRLVRGLSMNLVASECEGSVAIWRGAFLAQGLLMEPGCSISLEAICPGPEVALAMVGCARKPGAAVRSKEVWGTDRVSVRDPEAIRQLIEVMGAKEIFKTWQDRRERREARGNANHLANFDSANLRRSAGAAVVAGTRIERAFEILGSGVPAHPLEVGKLRLQYKQVSLEKLGKHTDPPLTKDAVAGQIRRLLAMADKVAYEQGIPDTETAPTLEMLEED